MKWLLLILAALIALVLLFGLKEYRKNFGARGAASSGFLEYYFSHHPELRHEAFSCRSNRGPAIRGVRLIPEREPMGLIVMTHGYNLSIENYMPLGKYFTESGFEVLMFDGVGVGLSEGDRIYGLPQHTLDMETVLKTVAKDEYLSALPLFLFGHSWGGYAATTVSCIASFPIRGIVTCGAFRTAISSMIPTIRRRFPKLSPIFEKSLKGMQYLSFGKLSNISAVKGLRAAACPARIYHSPDDAVVSYEESFIKTRDALTDLTDIVFITTEGRNHNLYLPPANDRRQREIHKILHSGGIGDEERKALIAELWMLMSETDEMLAAEFAEFYKGCLHA